MTQDDNPRNCQGPSKQLCQGLGPARPFPFHCLTLPLSFIRDRDHHVLGLCLSASNSQDGTKLKTDTQSPTVSPL